MPPELPSTISFGNERMYVTAKIYGNLSKLDSSSMLHGKVMVFSGEVSDNSPAIAKLPVSDALFKQEVWSTMFRLLQACLAVVVPC